MSECQYRKELNANLKKKQIELNKLYEDRKNLATCKETFWHVQHAINSLQVDIETIKSRLKNYGKDVCLPNIEIIK
jgi:hypothetical protein